MADSTTTIPLGRRVRDAGAAALALADASDGSDLDDGERQVVAIAGVLLSSTAGTLGSGQHRDHLRSHLAELLAEADQ